MLLPAETAKAWVEEVKEHSVVVQWLTVASSSRDLRFESLIRKFFFFPSVEKTVMWMVFKKRSTTKPQDDGSQEEVWWYHQQWWPLPDTCSKFSWAELYNQQFLNYLTQSDISMGAYMLESWIAKFEKMIKKYLSCCFLVPIIFQDWFKAFIESTLLERMGYPTKIPFRIDQSGPT